MDSLKKAELILFLLTFAPNEEMEKRLFVLQFTPARLRSRSDD